ncbi:hypothetical protein SLEP1_g4934 [Rubroshorea leprosula]|uniref:Uncharacterized protein n=1 Tax=Rubroshorea leprosula TaxID=152421 RepID=A0AAV5HZ46_9ROSI|nr:hypothetical protein SLEP1_g4934 [Rubroshorea leprosula]
MRLRCIHPLHSCLKTPIMIFYQAKATSLGGAAKQKKNETQPKPILLDMVNNSLVFV